MKFTIFGGRGFIGRNLAAHLDSLECEVVLPSRDWTPDNTQNLGHVVYCIGLTGDFRQRTSETIEAQAALLARLLPACRFNSWLYLSSTRVYGKNEPGRTSEVDSIVARPSADAIYDFSKLLGESICLAQPNPSVRIARLSNVYGPGMSRSTFLGSVVNALAIRQPVLIGEAPSSSKDYVSVDDVVALLYQIAVSGKERIYNLASGTSVTHLDIMTALSSASGQTIEFLPSADARIFPEISIARLRKEFSFAPRSVLTDAAHLLNSFKEQVKADV